MILITFETFIFLAALYVVHFTATHLEAPGVLCDAFRVGLAGFVQVWVQHNILLTHSQPCAYQQ
jgi:hypothetical protein